MPNLESHGFEFPAQLMIPKPQNFDALIFQEAGPLLISCAPLRKTMAATIEFNRELCLRAVEIEEVDATGVLPAKLELVEAAMAQQTPQTLFGIGGIFSKLARCGLGIKSARARWKTSSKRSAISSLSSARKA